MRTPFHRPAVEELERRDLLSISAFPITTNGIYPLSDQIDPGWSDRLVRFLATHFVGSQKMLPGENARYVADNPNWVLLNYRLATSSGPVPYIHNGSWSSDWSDVTPHEDWFMHNTAGLRLHNGGSNWDLHDINNPAWRQYWLNSVIGDLRTNHAQAIFA